MSLEVLFLFLTMCLAQGIFLVFAVDPRGGFQSDVALGLQNMTKMQCLLMT